MQTETIGILGIGNTLLQDEGFGPCCVERLERLYQLPDNVKVLDGGTAGILLAPFIEEIDILYLIDTVSLPDQPGTIHCFTDKDIYAKNIQTRMSPHQVGLLEILELCKLRGRAPAQVEMLTVVPEDLSVRIGLSVRLEPVVAVMLDLLVNRLAAHGVVLQKVRPAPDD